jgi:hypothetical protein
MQKIPKRFKRRQNSSRKKTRGSTRPRASSRRRAFALPKKQHLIDECKKWQKTAKFEHASARRTRRRALEKAVIKTKADLVEFRRTLEYTEGKIKDLSFAISMKTSVIQHSTHWVLDSDVYDSAAHLFFEGKHVVYEDNHWRFTVCTIYDDSIWFIELQRQWVDDMDYWYEWELEGIAKNADILDVVAKCGVEGVNCPNERMEEVLGLVNQIFSRRMFTADELASVWGVPTVICNLTHSYL